MRIPVSVVLPAAVVIGVVGARAAYSTATDGAPAPQQHLAAQQHAPHVAPVKPGPTFRWAPCPAGTERHASVCVRHVVRTVTLPAPVVTVPAAPVTQAPVTQAPVTQAPPAAPTQEPADEPSDEPSEEPGDDSGEHDGEHDGEHHEGEHDGDHEDDGGHDD